MLPESWRDRALAEVGGGERADPGDPIAAMIGAGAAHYRAQRPNPRLLTDAQLAALTMPIYVAIADRDSLPMQVAGPLDERLQKFWAPER